MDKLEIYQDALKRAGLRLTGPRQAICAWLAATDNHPTPYQVYEEISRDHPEMSRATVYNTLNTLQQLGVIVELSFGADHTHYDTNPSPHVNLICLRCHRITDMQAAAPLEALDSLSEVEGGFHALVARAEVLGLCDGCYASTRRTPEKGDGLHGVPLRRLEAAESAPGGSASADREAAVPEAAGPKTAEREHALPCFGAGKTTEHLPQKHQKRDGKGPAS